MLTDGILLLKKDFATEYFSKIDHFTSPANAGKIDDFFKQHFESKIAAASEIYSFDGTDAHIQINGPLSPDGPDLYDIFYGFGGCSYNAIVSATLQAAEDVDPSVGRVIFHMNTPGGSVDGCDSTFQVMSAISETHDTIAVNHGMIASAGIWLASACRNIEASTPVAFTGSIGVVVSTYDISEMLEKMGVKKVVITNHEASEKRPDIGTAEGQKLIQSELDAIYGVFKSRVLSGRKKMTAETIDGLKGSVKVASEALSLGLIDSIAGQSNPPATAGKTKVEVQKMKLTELLAANPDVKAEYDQSIIAAHAEGEAAGTDAMKATITAAAPYLSNEAYPTLGALALKVITGEESAATLSVSVTTIDAMTEQMRGKLAAGEGGLETLPGQVTEAEKAEADFKAHQARIAQYS